MNKITGYIFDDVFLKHDLEGHPETAKRLISIINKLEEDNFLSQLEKIKSRHASLDELKLCHTMDYINKVERVCSSGGGYLDQDTYTNKYSYEAAKVAAGGLIELTNSVINGKVQNGFAILRPPGHHALSDTGMGFCIFGNVSIAAKAALNNSSINKVAIVDIDVHHGNGTQALVADDPNILFISTHQYPFYPGTGSINETGTGNATGTVINIPLSTHTDDTSFKLIYDEIVLPALKRFNPDTIFVSAGYDAHWKDPLANMGLSLEGYSWISNKLIHSAENICSGKIVFALEGGYNLDVLSYGVLNSIKALQGKSDYEDPFGTSPNKSDDISDLISRLKKIHSL